MAVNPPAGGLGVQVPPPEQIRLNLYPRNATEYFGGISCIYSVAGAGLSGADFQEFFSLAGNAFFFIQQFLVDGLALG